MGKRVHIHEPHLNSAEYYKGEIVGKHLNGKLIVKAERYLRPPGIIKWGCGDYFILKKKVVELDPVWVTPVVT